MTAALKNLIGGKWTVPNTDQVHRILDPSDGRTVVGELRYSSEEEVDQAVRAAREAFPLWRDTPVIKRCRILFTIKERLEQRATEIAECIVRENGKLLAEAEGEVRRGIEVVEFAAGMPSLAKGDFIEDIAARVDGYVYREPLGVVAGACPFNFPAMIPLWMLPVAVACGNTFVLKPSERCPMTTTLVAEIFKDGGLPDGVLNVVQGDGSTFRRLIASPDVDAVSFVGSTAAAESVWRSAALEHERVQALGGAKNYLVVMPDAAVEETVKAAIGSACGCAGERCMATSVLALVGDTGTILEKIVAAAKGLKLGNGLDPATGMGPVISAEHKKRVEEYIALGVTEGAKLLLDGRGASVPKRPGGFFVGPTILDDVRPEMRVAREEIFGPVLSVMRFRDLDEAIEAANSSLYGNGASIFTSSGGAARKFRNSIQCGMIGINAGVPAPMAFFSFGGFKKSIFGDMKSHGTEAVEFYTQRKAVIERWFGDGKTGSVWSK